MLKKNFASATVITLLMPAIVMAQGKTVNVVIDDLTTWALAIVNFLLVLATLVFLWGIIKYITSGGDAAKVKEARSYILWGLIGLAVMGSAWAITRYLQRQFIGVEDTGTIPRYNR